MSIRRALFTLILIPASIAMFAAEPAFKEQVFEALNTLYSGDYEGALNSASQIENDFPSSNAGEFLKAGIFSTYMSDFETDTLNDSLLKYCNSIISSSDSKDAFETFFKGGALLYKAYYYAGRNLYPSAISHGLKALEYFDRSIDLDTSLYDAYLGRGLVKYFIYKFKDKVPFIKADLNGLEEIEISADKGLFSRIPAYDMLCILYGMEGMNGKAMERIGELRSQYPDNRMFMYTEYKIRMAEEDYGNAVKILETLKENIEETQNLTYYNLMYVYSNLASAYLKNGDKIKSLYYADKTLGFREHAKKEQRLKVFIRDAEKTKKSIGEKD